MKKPKTRTRTTTVPLSSTTSKAVSDTIQELSAELQLHPAVVVKARAISIEVSGDDALKVSAVLGSAIAQALMADDPQKDGE